MRAAAVLAALLVAACGESGRDTVPVPGQPDRAKSAAAVRAERRAYDGAPPVVPHDSFGVDCMNCHGLRGMEVPGIGFAPPMPHALTAGLGAASRCVQCHVFQRTEETFVASDFDGLEQDLRSGRRHHPLAPPVMPHAEFMRENCRACHSGPAAREEIRTTHPERPRCRQCHVPRETTELWRRP